MKKFTFFDKGHRGQLPPDLVALIGDRSRGVATREFIDAMTQIARDYHAAIDVDKMTYADIAQIKLKAPTLFGVPTQLTYIASGTSGSIYKLTIAGHDYALKINRLNRACASDLEGMHLYAKARHLINRPHIGATFDVGDKTYSWTLDDCVSGHSEQSYQRAREKLFYAGLTKGIAYSDFHSDNVLGGRIIDKGGVYQKKIDLTRDELDRVKKFVYAMRTGNMDEFAEMARISMTEAPSVLKYLFINMNLAKFEMPEKFLPYLDVVSAYYRMVNPLPQTHVR